jgi:hypothetical protein
LASTLIQYVQKRIAFRIGEVDTNGIHKGHFPNTGITDNLTNGGASSLRKKMASHSKAKTTGLYDRRNDDVSVSEVERVGEVERIGI